LGLGVNQPDDFGFTGLSLDETVTAFSERAYGQALSF
jgi:hypothetical protein